MDKGLSLGDRGKRIKGEQRPFFVKIVHLIPGQGLSLIHIFLTGESGPDHDKQVQVEVHLNSNVIGTGKGRSKKEAEQAAAKEALALMGYGR